jgi:hypothetical protein
MATPVWYSSIDLIGMIRWGIWCMFRGSIRANALREPARRQVR